MNDRTLLELLRKIVYKETLYLRHYYAQIVDVADPLNEGRVRVACDWLGLNQGAAIWASPRGKNGITTPAVNQWIEIYFMNGDRDRCVYLGVVMDFDKMLPKNFDGDPKTHVLFEDIGNQIHIKYDEAGNILEIGNTDMQFVARQTDGITIDATTDPAFISAITGAFGITSVKGKITGGSTQIKAGSK